MWGYKGGEEYLVRSWGGGGGGLPCGVIRGVRIPMGGGLNCEVIR